MNYNFKLKSEVLDTINIYADEVTDLLYDKVPFFMVFAVTNENRKTEYMTFNIQPEEVGLKLNVNKFPKITGLFELPADGTPSENKNVSLGADDKKALELLLNKITYFCEQNKIPFFFMVAVNNKKTEKSSKTDYKMELMSPYYLNLELYDDRITKILRYTYDPDIYPGKTMELTDDFGDLDSMLDDIPEEYDDIDTADDEPEDMYEDETETEDITDDCLPPDDFPAE